jgi:hypothetical protein
MRAAAKTRAWAAWRRLTACVVAVWLTGSGCLVCCGGGEAVAVASDLSIEVSTPATAAAERAGVRTDSPESDHACCRAKLPPRAQSSSSSLVEGRDATGSTHDGGDDLTSAEGDGGFVRGPARPGRVRGCCERTGQTLDSPRQPRPAPRVSPSAGPAMFFVHAASPARAFSTPAERRARLPDSRPARLLACVFLI